MIMKGPGVDWFEMILLDVVNFVHLRLRNGQEKFAGLWRIFDSAVPRLIQWVLESL
jgi:hypothetical protein